MKKSSLLLEMDGQQRVWAKPLVQAHMHTGAQSYVGVTKQEEEEEEEMRDVHDFLCPCLHRARGSLRLRHPGGWPMRIFASFSLGVARCVQTERLGLRRGRALAMPWTSLDQIGKCESSYWLRMPYLPVVRDAFGTIVALVECNFVFFFVAKYGGLGGNGGFAKQT